MESTSLESLGTQDVSPWTVRLSAVTAVLTGLTIGSQLGPVTGGAVAAIGLGGALALRRRSGLPCYTIADDALIRHVGRGARSYAWSTLRRPVRLRRVHLEDFLLVRRDSGRVLLPLAGLDGEERERLRQVVSAVVAHRSAAAALGTAVRGSER